MTKCLANGVFAGSYFKTVGIVLVKKIKLGTINYKNIFANL